MEKEIVLKNINNSNIKGSFISNKKTLKDIKKDEKTKEFNKIENKYICNICFTIIVIGVLMLFNIFNNYALFIISRLSVLLNSIYILIIMLIRLFIIKIEYSKKLNILSNINCNLYSISLFENNRIYLNIIYKNKYTHIKINDVTIIKNTKKEKLEYDFITNTLILPYKKKNIESKIIFSNTINIVKNLLYKNTIKKMSIIFLIFIIILAIIIRNFKYLLLSLFPILLIFILITILLIHNELENYNIKDFEEIKDFKLLNYKNLKLILEDNKNEIKTLKLENFKEEINKNNNIEINILKKIIKIPKNN